MSEKLTEKIDEIKDLARDNKEKISVIIIRVDNLERIHSAKTTTYEQERESAYQKRWEVLTSTIKFLTSIILSIFGFFLSMYFMNLLK